MKTNNKKGIIRGHVCRDKMLRGLKRKKKTRCCYNYYERLPNTTTTNKKNYQDKLPIHEKKEKICAFLH